MARSFPVTLADRDREATQIEVALGWFNPDQDPDDWYTPETDPDLAYERHLENLGWQDAMEEREREGHLWPWNMA